MRLDLVDLVAELLHAALRRLRVADERRLLLLRGLQRRHLLLELRHTAALRRRRRLLERTDLRDEGLLLRRRRRELRVELVELRLQGRLAAHPGAAIRLLEERSLEGEGRLEALELIREVALCRLEVYLRLHRLLTQQRLLRAHRRRRRRAALAGARLHRLRAAARRRRGGGGAAAAAAEHGGELRRRRRVPALGSAEERRRPPRAPRARGRRRTVRRGGRERRAARLVVRQARGEGIDRRLQLRDLRLGGVLRDDRLVLDLARAVAYLSVFSVSSRSASDGDTHASIIVFELPPSESWSRRVSFESRYGTWWWRSQRALITLPRARRPLLI